MRRFDAIDLSTLKPGNAVAPLDYEFILSLRVADLQQRWPAWDMPALETDPLKIDMEVGAYRELLVRADANDKYRAATLAFAAGQDLDVKAAEFGTTRKLLDIGDPNATPPIAPTYESDEDLRRRAQLAWEALTVAGSAGSYIYHALSAHADVLDAAVFGPESEEDVDPGQVRLTILSRAEDGVADAELLDVVETYVSADNRRPLTDQVIVESATIETYEVEAVIKVGSGPDAELVREAAEAAVLTYVTDRKRIGFPVRLSRLHAALYVGDDTGRSAVEDLELVSPVADIEPGARGAAVCEGVTITVEVI